LALALGTLSHGAGTGDLVAVRAGTVHCVENGLTFEGGATILIRDGKIIAVGKDIEIPGDAEVVDYGPDAVVIPGLVAPFSPYGSGQPARRTASPGTHALDNYDPFKLYATGLSAGVTSAYITPGENRLISGLGALVKLAGDDPEARVVNANAAIHGSVDVYSRRTPGYWDPPLPVNAEQELGYAKPQLPATAMGAIVALDELVGAVRDATQVESVAKEYGDYAVSDLGPLMAAGVPWRISAQTENEIRAVLRFADTHKLPLVLERVGDGKLLADEIAKAGVPVIYRVPFNPNTGSSDKSQSPDAHWPEYDVPAVLTRAGVRVAIASQDPSDLLFSAALAMRGGLSAEDALRAITLTPAQVLGAAERVGSLSAGKDADLCVLNAEPLSGYASVLATWVDGEVSWKVAGSESSATVLEVDELYVGDGQVLRPGQILIQDARIREVGSRVSHPVGAKVVHGQSAMPGMIDAFGHLGLEGSKGRPAIDFDMTSIISPGDAVDRKVAARGITTVVMTPRAASRDGAPAIAYKPAASEFDHQIVDGLAAVRLNWGESNTQAPGASVKGLLASAKAYGAKWAAYEKAMAGWTPAAATSDAGDEAAEEEVTEEAKDEAKEEKAPKKSSKKKKKKEEEVIEPDPITGRWLATDYVAPPKEKPKKSKKKSSKKSDDEKKAADKASDEAGKPEEGAPEEPKQLFKMRLYFAAEQGSGEVTGNLRCPEISMDLVQLIGQWDREGKKLTLNGLGDRGWVTLDADYKEKKFNGTLKGAGQELKFTATRTEKENVVADRKERRKPETTSVKAPKGKPKMPRREGKLEPYLRAMRGELAVVVEVYREDAILDCVKTFEAYGIRPVLFGATGAHYVADQIAGRVAGVLLDRRIRLYESDKGTRFRTPYSTLQSLGIPVAFHSGSESGAADLPIIAAYAVANGMSPEGAIRALTSDAAAMMAIDDRVGLLKNGLDADVLLLDGPPLAPGTSVVRTWVAGEEIR